MFLGEYVLYNGDTEKIIYRVISKNEEKIELQGLNYRKKIVVQASMVKQINNEIYKSEEEKNNLYSSKMLFRNKKNQCLLGTVLHFDSDKEYLNRCLDFYKSVGIYCYPILCEAEKISFKLNELDLNFIPDVIVITGHDYYNGENPREIENYSNSRHFIEAVKMAKIKYCNSVIIAGACQSHFEALLASGANFASSPKRINVHVYDPAIIAANVCTTSIRSVVDYKKIEKYIIDLKNAYGGVETFGKMKMLY